MSRTGACHSTHPASAAARHRRAARQRPELAAALEALRRCLPDVENLLHAPVPHPAMLRRAATNAVQAANHLLAALPADASDPTPHPDHSTAGDAGRLEPR